MLQFLFSYPDSFVAMIHGSLDVKGILNKKPKDFWIDLFYKLDVFVPNPKKLDFIASLFRIKHSVSFLSGKKITIKAMRSFQSS